LLFGGKGCLKKPGFWAAPGTRNRVSLRNVCHPTDPYIETRFLNALGFGVN
jgi:hypothetical protein